jgi:hypothetical protein
MFVDRVELSAADGVEENFGGFLNTLEKGIVFCGASSSFFVGVMPKNLLTMGSFDLLFCSFVAVFRETEDGIVILTL